MSKHIVIVGAGVVGILSAHFLLEQGYKVTVVERHERVCSEASAANASCMHNLYIHPKGEPHIFGQLPSILFGLEPMLKIRKLYRPSHLVWAMNLLWQSLPTNSEKNQQSLNVLSLVSNKLHQENKIKYCNNYDYNDSSKILIYENSKALSYNRRKYDSYQTEKNQIDLLSSDELIEKEPVLQHNADKIAGAIEVHTDHFADCEKFTLSLAENLLKNYPDHFVIRLSSNVTNFNTSKHTVRAIEINNEEELSADIFVLASGIGSKKLAKKLGVRVPIIPVKGYTVCVPYKDQEVKLSRNITYTSRFMVIAPYNDRVRLSSGFFIGEDDYEIRKDRVKVLRDNAKYILPDLEFDNEIVHMGHRACMSNSLPLTKLLKGYDNVILNAGHGMYGWSLAHVCGEKMHQIAEKI